MNRYLTKEASMLIEWELRQGHSFSKIARKCNRGHSTIIDEESKTLIEVKLWQGLPLQKLKKHC